MQSSTSTGALSPVSLTKNPSSTDADTPTPGTSRLQAFGYRARSASRRRGNRIASAAVLGSLVVGTTAWVSLDNSVTINDDGQVRTLHTFSGSVSGTLAKADISIGEHDVVAPGLESSISDGGTIVIQRGRLVRLSVDGQTREVWVTSSDVDGALAELGLTDTRLVATASRSRSIDRSGTDLSVRTARAVTVTVDGTELPITTDAFTVRDVLAQLGVRLGPTDVVAPALTADPTAGLAIAVTRVAVVPEVETLTVPHGGVEQVDPSRLVGQRDLVDPGADGVTLRTWNVTYTNGVETAKDFGGDVVQSEPRDAVTVVGSKPVPPPPPPAAPVRPAPAPAPAVRPAPAPQAQAPAPAGAGGLNWAALAACESGGNPRAVSPGGLYRGLYQFSLGTWAGVGGSGDPINASAAEQTLRAQILYSRSGAGPWPVCGRNLFR